MGIQPQPLCHKDNSEKNLSLLKGQVIMEFCPEGIQYSRITVLYLSITGRDCKSTRSRDLLKEGSEYGSVRRVFYRPVPDSLFVNFIGKLYLYSDHFKP